ncbi:aromatic acid exporter family protein [Heyndrickxia sp. NPDC080065]|uniref:aromatic acid exporter family protein n=1 Tax=Heyndrickxia sp. NPDC080065 TaxID=3390568 RepID=UPI003D00231A
MFRIGYRTLKTAIATPIAIYIAQLLHLQNYFSAGILAILCIQSTKMKSIRAAWSRFAACVLAMILSTLFFSLFGQHPFVIGLVLLIFIPSTVYLKVNEGVVSSSVIILHFLAAKSIDSHLVLNEFAIILIGIGVALIINLYMPSLDHQLIKYQKKIEDNFRKIFEEIILYLRTNKNTWDGKEITETADIIEKAKSLALRDVENRFVTNESFFYSYFKMREKQFEIIERSLPVITSISSMIEQRMMMADFVEDLKENIQPKNTAIERLKKLYSMREQINQMDLPKTREEFEARASLFQFMREIEQYLTIKSNFKHSKNSHSKHQVKAH